MFNDRWGHEMEILQASVTIVRLIFLLCLLSGYVYVVCEKLDIESRIAPIFVLTSISSIVYLAGIIGGLLWSVYLIAVGGVVAFIYMITKLRKVEFSLLKITMFQIMFAFGASIFLLQMLSMNLTHYDNFTHWVVIVKELLITDAFITSDNVMIGFSNYPVGTASLIYFVCKIVGTYQNIMILAQGLLIFAAFLAIFGIIQEKKRFLLTVVLGTGCSFMAFFNVTIRISDLLVDFVLPILGLAAIAVIYRYRQNLNKMLVISTPILGLLMIVKSTGIIYACVAIIYLWYQVIKHHLVKYKEKKTDSYLKIVGANIVSFLPYLLWNQYVNTVLADTYNKFDVDSEQIASIYGDKTAEDVQIIIKLYIESLLDFTERATIGLVILQVSAIIACFIGYKIIKKKWSMGKVLIAMDFVVVIYLIGILAMYIFMMPLEEAIYLAGYQRYVSSIVVFFCGVLTMSLTVDIENSFYYRLGEVEEYKSFYSVHSKEIYNNSVIACAMILVFGLSSEYNGMQSVISDYDESVPARVEAVVGDNWGEVSLDSYLVYGSDEDGEVSDGYFEFVVKYYLRGQNVEVISSLEEEGIIELLSQYTYLVVIDADDEIEELMEKTFGTQVENDIYEIDILMENFNNT